MGRGRRSLSSERFSSPSPNPTLSSSKTFVFIESLMLALRVAGMGRAVALRVENDAEEAAE